MPDSALQLIVNADDFGRAPGIVAGVVTARTRGILTSASLMVRWPAAAAAARFAREDLDLSVGLHVDLGEWVHRDRGWTPVYEVCNLADELAVDVEVRRQLLAFRSLVGHDPTHLDSHQHVHRQGAPRAVLGRLAESLGVPLRGVDPGVSHLGDFYGQTGTGDPLHDRIAPEALIAIFDGLRPGVTELGCHPGDGSDRLPPYEAERRIELETLCHAAVRQALRDRDIALVSFAGLTH